MKFAGAVADSVGIQPLRVHHRDGGHYWAVPTPLAPPEGGLDPDHRRGPRLVQLVRETAKTLDRPRVTVQKCTRGGLPGGRCGHFLAGRLREPIDKTD